MYVLGLGLGLEAPGLGLETPGLGLGLEGPDLRWPRGLFIKHVHTKKALFDPASPPVTNCNTFVEPLKVRHKFESGGAGAHLRF